jgi:hypothetical protein
MHCHLFKWFLVVFGLFALTVAMAGNTCAQDETTGGLLREYQKSLQHHFRKQGLVPLYDYGVNYRIGDVWDPSMTRLLEGSEQCFPGLQFRSAPDSVPTLSYFREAAAGFLLALERFFKVSASGNLSHTVTVSFVDVVEEVAAEGDLRKTFSARACPEIAPIVGEGAINQDSLIGVVISRLYIGKRVISIGYADQATARTRADEITRLAGAAPVSVGLSGSVTNEDSITIADKNPVPLGYAPAFVPVRVGGLHQGPGDQQPEYGWRFFNPADNPSQSLVLDELAAAGQSKWHWRDR